MFVEKTGANEMYTMKRYGTYASMLPQKSRTFPSVTGKNRNMPKRLANQIKHKIIQFTKLQTIVNMNLSQLSENLLCAEMVIQFCQEKNLIGKIKSCWPCEHPCHLKKMRKSYAWRCRNTKCRTWIIIK